MGCKDGWSSSGMIVKVTFFIVFVSMFANWIAFTTSSWIVVSFVHLGLWRACTETAGAGCVVVDGTGNVRFGVTQAFSIMGFIAQNIGFLLIILYMFKKKCMGNGEVGMAAGVLLIISAVGWLIAVAVLGGDQTDTPENLNYSYGLAVVACGLGLIGGILMLIGSRESGSSK